MEKSLRSIFEDIENRGLYVCAHFDEETVENISAYMREHNISNAVLPHDLHTTIVYSRKSIPWTPIENLSVDAKPIELTIFDTRDGKKCLVVLLDCPWLRERFETAMSLGATYDFPSYKPHVTLSYDFEGDIPSSLPVFPFRLNSEHNSPLKD